MDLDFLLITTIYLLVILTIHYYLKESEKKIPVKQVLIKKVPETDIAPAAIIDIINITTDSSIKLNPDLCFLLFIELKK